jgi:putative endonuclease
MQRNEALRKAADRRGRFAEDRAAAALAAEGWSVLARRVRTAAGEIDLVAERDGLLAFVEVKARATLGEAVAALGAAQRRRLMQAGEIWLGANPGRGETGVRFDVVVVDAEGRVRRIADAFRLGD